MQYDAVVVGAGPYGLSTAAHLLGRGVRAAVFGRPLELWRNHMPDGMLLRSHRWASGLSDPRGEYAFDRFIRESGHDASYPVPREVFIEYGLWFQKHAVPEVDHTYVSSIERRNQHYLLTLEDGRTVQTAAVVMAIGLYYYAHRPGQFDHLRAGLVSHSCDHRDFRRFDGREVIVIGGGQSAIEYAALLHEAGARVHVVSRRPIAWRDPDRAGSRTSIQRMLAPTASIAPGWQNWVLDHAPYLFHRLPQPAKDNYNSNYASGAADWLRPRVIGRVTLHEGHTLVESEMRDGNVVATISNGRRVRADHIMLATGYRVDISRLTMIHPSLHAQITTNRSVPVLNPWFESTVPGLYFVGLTSLAAFGPLYRFVAGCQATARRVTAAISRPLPHCRRLSVNQTLRSFAR